MMFRSSLAASCRQVMKNCYSTPVLRACFTRARRWSRLPTRFGRCQHALVQCEAVSCNEGNAMNKPDQARLFESEVQQAERRWHNAYDATAEAKQSVNRSGIEI